MISLVLPSLPTSLHELLFHLLRLHYCTVGLLHAILRMHQTLYNWNSGYAA
jgi:hypothetical protein